VRAGLRRNARDADRIAVLHLRLVQIDLARRITRGPEGDLHLTHLEYRIIECLARQTGMVVRQRQLVTEAGLGYGVDR
jgi:two-component system KDP operon response regulator KdpE